MSHNSCSENLEFDVCLRGQDVIQSKKKKQRRVDMHLDMEEIMVFILLP